MGAGGAPRALARPPTSDALGAGRLSPRACALVGVRALGCASGARGVEGLLKPRAGPESAPEAVAAGKKLNDELRKEIIEGIANTIRLTNPKGMRWERLRGGSSREVTLESANFGVGSTITWLEWANACGICLTGLGFVSVKSGSTRKTVASVRFMFARLTGWAPPHLRPGASASDEASRHGTWYVGCGVVPATRLQNVGVASASGRPPTLGTSCPTDGACVA